MFPSRFVPLLMWFLGLVLATETSPWVRAADWAIGFHLIVISKDFSVQILFLCFQMLFSFLAVATVILAAATANLHPGCRPDSLRCPYRVLLLTASVLEHQYQDHLSKD